MRKNWVVWLGAAGLMSVAANGEETRSPFPKHDRAVAYAFNQEEDQIEPILHEGRLNSTTSEKLTRALSREQVGELAPLVTGKRPPHEKADCYYPRHAVVFYEGAKPVGYLEVCFECYEYQSDIKGLASIWDLKGLARFFRGLKFPVNWNDEIFDRLNKGN